MLLYLHKLQISKISLMKTFRAITVKMLMCLYPSDLGGYTHIKQKLK